MYTQEELTAMKTGYGQALMDPKNGPLVGVPQFVPVETHRERVKIVASVSTTGGDGTIILNPYALGTDCSSDITGNVAASTVNSFKPLVFAPAASITDTTASGILHFESNASTKPTEFADGAVKARLVSARLAVTNTSSLNSRNGTFCALRERHHHGLDGVDFDEASRQSNAVVKSATAGTVAINYRPVKPEEVDSWLEVRTSPSWGHLMLPGDIMNGPNDAGIMDVSPGFMGVWIKGSGAQTFLVEVDAIFEYCGDSRTSLVKPIHIGHRNKAEPKHIAPVGKGVDKANTTQDRRSLMSMSDSSMGTGIDKRPRTADSEQPMDIMSIVRRGRPRMRRGTSRSTRVSGYVNWRSTKKPAKRKYTRRTTKKKRYVRRRRY